MYILAINLPLDKIQPKIVFHNSMGSPLGRIALAGLLKEHAGVPEKPMRVLGHYALVYLLKGKGAFRSAGGVHFPLVPGDLWFVFPEIAHWYGPEKGSLWDEFYIVFSGPLFDLWRQRGLFNSGQPIGNLLPTDYWLRRLHEVVADELDPLQQICSLQHLLAEVIAASDSSREPHWLGQARTLLQTTEDMATISRELGMTYEAFRKRFTAATAVSPSRYRTMKRIDRACALMAASDLTNKEIAEQLGFYDEFHFSRQFTQLMGLTPTQFRLRKPRQP